MAVLLRSFAVQGSWNYETLIGTGFAFTLLPALRRVYRGEEALRAALARHSTLFNSHPYLSTIAVGAVCRLEADGVDPKIVDRFKIAMRGSLGSMGDQLIWSAWRPASVLLGLALLLAGAPWWLGLSAFLVVYNGLHLAVRVWGLRAGSEAGLEVGRVLRDAPLQPVARRASEVGALLCGFAAVLPLGPLESTPAEIVPVALAIGLGLWLGAAVRKATVGAVVVAWILGMVYSWIA